MTEVAIAPMPDARAQTRWLTGLLIGFAVVHLLLLLLDVHYPAAFLRADRAVDRMDNIDALRQLHRWKDLLRYMGTGGNIGDYAPQAMIYLIAGKFALIVCQSALMLLSGACVFWLARMTTLSAPASCCAAVLYLASPHSLVFPHQLASEAIYVPLLTIATWATCEAIRRGRRSTLIWSGLLLGIATLVRPITLLWPPVVAWGLHRLNPRSARPVFAAVAYLPVVIWMALVWQQAGTIGMGESDHSLPVNLYGRVEAIAAALPPDTQRNITQRYLSGVARTKFSTAEFFSFGLHYPLPFLSYTTRDALIFLCKSGIERFTVDYLASDQQAGALQTPSGDSWRQHLDKYGMASAVRYGWRVLGATFLISALASAAQIALTILAVIGAVHLIRLMRDRALPKASQLAGFLVVALPIYIFIFSLVLIATQSRQRAPAEFALAILATHGLWRLAVPRVRQREFSPA